MKRSLLIACVGAALLALAAIPLLLPRSDIPPLESAVRKPSPGSESRAAGAGAAPGGALAGHRGGGLSRGRLGAAPGGGRPADPSGSSHAPGGTRSRRAAGPGAADAGSGRGARPRDRAGRSAARAPGESGMPRSELARGIEKAIQEEDLGAVQALLTLGLTERGTRFTAEDLPTLFDALIGVQDYGVQKLALTHLARVDAPAEDLVDGYLEYLNGSKRPALASEVFQQIERVGGDAALRGLSDIVRESADARIRWQAAESLGKLGDPRAVPVLREALETAQDVQRVHPFTQALARIGGEQAVSSLVDFLAIEGNEPALTALREIREPEAAPILAERLNRGASEGYQLVAVRMLRDLPNPEALPALTRYLDGASGRLARETIEALARIRDPRAAEALEGYAASRKDPRLIRQAQLAARRVRYLLERPEPPPPSPPRPPRPEAHGAARVSGRRP